MKISIVMVLASLASLSGCAPPGTLSVAFEGTDASYVVALRAADEWNRTCGVELIHVRRGRAMLGEVEMHDQTGMDHGAYGETTRERPVLGFAGEKVTTHIWFMAGWTALPVLTHEFGHALGLGHASSGIMQQGASWEHLDPATERTSLRPGLITPDDCVRVTW